MKEGMPIIAERYPLINPTTKPKNIHKKISKPQWISKVLKPMIIIIALTAMVDPTEMSNLPKIKTSVTAIQMLPSSAPSLAKVRRLKLDEKKGVVRWKKT